MMGEEEITSNMEHLARRSGFGCLSWSFWILATSLGAGAGWYLGWWTSIRLPGQLSSPILGLLVGLILGFSQWVILRAYLPRAAWWIPASGLGWGIGFPAGAALAYLVGLVDLWFGVGVGAVIGLLSGIFQWLILRGRSSYAVWWVPASLFAWSAALMFYQGGLSWLGAYYGLMVGIATGLALLGIFGFSEERS